MDLICSHKNVMCSAPKQVIVVLPHHVTSLSWLHVVFNKNARAPSFHPQTGKVAASIRDQIFGYKVKYTIKKYIYRLRNHFFDNHIVKEVNF